eukprot:TRINITY_DN1429_c0_g1_i22.p1 TRINITY_DN1429_c0_g1~~TRINITY_DN1429_c0_g1_i22.p1  ORF type:complete len:501 (-),score=117.07 TRINITY_DN1429_c0_g1_i22:163-1665(-)
MGETSICGHWMSCGRTLRSLKDFSPADSTPLTSTYPPLICRLNRTRWGYTRRTYQCSYQRQFRMCRSLTRAWQSPSSSTPLPSPRAEIVDPGLFKSKFILYTITTPAKGYQVERRYSDFYALRQEMLHLYPGYVVPPLPSKKVPGNVDINFIQERKSKLQLFLNDVFKHPLLRNFELFVVFLSADRKEWEERSKGIGKTSVAVLTSKVGNAIKNASLSELSQYETIEGEAKLLFTNATRQYCDKVDGSSKGLHDCYKELKEVNRELMTSFEKISATMNRAGDLYKKIGSILNSFGERSTSDVFGYMSAAHLEQGEIFRMFKSDYNTYYADFYSFFANEMSSVEELSQKRKNAEEHTNTNEKKLYKKKEQLFEMRNTMKWDLDPSAMANIEAIVSNKSMAMREILSKESEECRKMRMYYGYYSNKLEEEFHRILKKNTQAFKAQFEKSTEAFTENYEKLRKVCFELLTNLKEVTVEDGNEVGIGLEGTPPYQSAPITLDDE